MEFLFEIFWVTVRSIIFDILLFNIGKVFLRLISFGAYPDDDELKEEKKLYGDYWWFFCGPKHGFVCLTGFLISLIFYFAFLSKMF